MMPVPVDQPERVRRPIGIRNLAGISTDPLGEGMRQSLNRGFNAVLALEARDDDIELQLSDSGEDRLAAHVVG